jgi:uncharacterized membrane protein (DUF2068 family)
MSLATHSRPVGGRDRTLLAIALFKLLKAASLFAIGIGLFRLVHDGVAATVEGWIARFRVDPGQHFINLLLQRLTGIDPRKLEWIGVGTLFYATIFLIEGIGLLLRKRWAEWMTVISTSLLLPLEVFELSRHVTWPKALTLIANVLVVIYLIVLLRRQNALESASDEHA